MGDIIDLKARRKGTIVTEESSYKAPVTDITTTREEQIRSERRDAKRTILNGFIGASVVVPGRGLLKVGIFDISKGGLSFDISAEAGHFGENEEVAMRFYFNHNAYFPFVVRITSHRISASDGICRHGAIFVSELSNIPVLQHFVDFLEAVVTDLKHDKGDLFINEFGL